VTLAFLVEAYDEEKLVDDKGKEDTRVVMRFHPALAPFKAAVLPLQKNKLGAQAEALHEELSKYFMVDYDANGNIGKRYRREDEIGTPYCICVDFETEEDHCVTVRDRDTMEQVRIPVEEVKDYIAQRITF
jgi:glycyl-tRNA synthetase